MDTYFLLQDIHADLPLMAANSELRTRARNAPGRSKTKCHNQPSPQTDPKTAPHRGFCMQRATLEKNCAGHVRLKFSANPSLAKSAGRESHGWLIWAMEGAHHWLPWHTFRAHTSRAKGTSKLTRLLGTMGKHTHTQTCANG